MNKEETLLKDLENITAEYRRSGSLGEAEPEIERILQESRKTKWAEGIARCLYLQAGLHESRREMQKAEELNEQAKKLAEGTGLDDIIADCLALEANLYLWNNKLKEAYRISLDALTKAESSNNDYAIAFSHYILGRISKRYASDDQALKYFQSALENARKFEFLKLQGSILNELSGLFLIRQRFNQAEQCALQCLAIGNKLGVLSRILHTKILIITILIEANEVKQAQSLIDEISEFEDQLGFIERGTFALCKGKAAFRTKDYPEAYKFLKSSLKIFTEFGRVRLIVNANGILGEMFLEQQKAKEAIACAKQALKNIKPGTDDYLESQTYRLMYEASKLAKNTSDALKYLELYNERFTKQEEQLLETRIQFIELNAEYQMRQAEITEQRRRANELRIELEYKEQELTEKTRHLIRQTDVIAQFRDDLRAIIRRSSADDPLIQEIKDRLKQVPEDSQTWEDFTKQFEAAHPIFLLNLEERHPLLSTMEKKICTLLRVGLTSSDIAKLLHLSDRNIENHRYRIRKKIALNTEESLHEYLSRIQ